MYCVGRLQGSNAEGGAHRSRLVLLLPDLGLLKEEQTVDEHGSDGDEAHAEGDTPDSVQSIVVVLAAGLAKGSQQQAEHGCVHHVTPSLWQQLICINYCAPDSQHEIDSPRKVLVTLA